MTPEQLKQRTKTFGLRCLKVAEAMPRTLSGRTIAGQLARSGTSVAANYRAASRARSHRDFISKIGVFEEEADETAFWLDLAVEAGVIKSTKVCELLAEAGELTAIFAASHITATKSARRATPGHAPRINQQSAISNQQ